MKNNRTKLNLEEILNIHQDIETQQLDELSKLVEEYPFFHAVRLVYVYHLYKHHHPLFQQELQRASLLIPDRKALFELLEQPSHQTTSHIPIVTEDDRSQPFSLIDNYLSNSSDNNETPTTPPHTVPTLAEVTSDYATFLASLPATNDSETEVNTEQWGGTDGTLIDNFISQTQGKQRYDMALDEDNAEQPTTSASTETNSTTSTIPPPHYNERIANLYIQQGRYEEALRIFQNISLENPQKNSNFAAKIQLLKEILEKNK